MKPPLAELLQFRQTILDANGQPRLLFDAQAYRSGADRAAEMPRSEAIAVMRSSGRGGFGLIEIAATLIAIGFIVLGIQIGGRIGEIVGVAGVVATVFGAIPFKLRRDVPGRIVPAMIAAGYCPSCCRKLCQADSSGLCACPGCAAVWKSAS